MKVNWLRLVLTAAILAVWAIPYTIYHWVQSNLNPVGFWQNLAMLFAGVYFLGAVQIVLIIVGMAVLVVIWFDQTLDL